MGPKNVISPNCFESPPVEDFLCLKHFRTLFMASIVFLFSGELKTGLRYAAMSTSELKLCFYMYMPDMLVQGMQCTIIRFAINYFCR